jgi:hypothetical protein
MDLRAGRCELDPVDSGQLRDDHQWHRFLLFCMVPDPNDENRLSVFENRVLRGIFEPKAKEITGD